MKDDKTGDIFAYEPPQTPLPPAQWGNEPQGLARNTDPETSHEAALGISPRIRELQMTVLRFAGEASDGFTDVAMNRHFGTHGSTYRTRRAELVALGFIRDSGERHTYGEGGAGRRHIIWVITLAGLNKLRETPA